MQYVPEQSYIPGRNYQPFRVAQDQAAALAANYQDLSRLGIVLNSQHLYEMQRYAAMFAQDADFQAPITSSSITTPVQFLQSWLPGFVYDVTAARRIDDLIGIVTQGSWYDEEIVQGILEREGTPLPYGDYTNVPFSSWNANWERRNIIRFEEGMRIGVLEEQRASAIRVNSPDAKRIAAARALEIQRNRVGFLGYNGGLNRTYGFLNEPNLPAYIPVAAGSVDQNWSNKSFLEIQADLLTGFQSLRTQSQDIIDPQRVPITLAVATNAVDFLSTTTDFGTVSVTDWINKSYPLTRIVSAPELNTAASGEGVFYMYAETVGDSGSDDNRTFIQVVPTRFMTLGVERNAKSYIEDYSNATAGVLLKRPYAVVRYSGISNA